jgi:CheY-like chemotaxis protein
MMALNGMRVLLADDDEYDMRPTIIALEAEGASVEVVTDGTTALTVLQRDRESPPDLLILDIMMDQGDAIETDDEGRSTGARVYEKIRKELKLNLPIVVSSVVTDPKILKVFRNDPRIQMLSKPYGFSELHQAISRLLRS